MDDVIASLTLTTGVTKWDSIRFSLLPSDEPQGYVQPSRVSFTQTIRTTRYMGVIGLAALTLEELWADVEQMVSSLQTYQRAQCVGGMSGKLVGDIVIDIPDTYSTQAHQSSTSAGFKTSIAFELEVSL